MVQRSIIFGLFLCGILPCAAYADSDVRGELNETVWYLDTVVMINGTNLQGPIPSLSKLCFAPESNKEDLKCFKADHANITKWTPSNITFTPPKNAPPLGVVILIQYEDRETCQILFGEKECETERVKMNKEIATYKAHPQIANVLDLTTKDPATYLKAGRIYEVQGYRFGDTGKGIYFGSLLLDKTDIIRWTHDSIQFSPSDISRVRSLDLRVHNGAGLGNAWNFETKQEQYIEVHSRTRGTIKILASTVVSSDTNNDEQLEQSTSSSSIIENEIEVKEDELIQEENTKVESSTGVLFTDVAMDHLYAEAITWAKDEHVVDGYEDGSFHPDQVVNRAEFLKMLLETDSSFAIETSGSGSEVPSFPDVDTEAWYAPYVAAALEKGLAKGYADGRFQPEQDVNFAEALKIAYRFYQVPTLDAEEDVWYARYAKHALLNNILFTTEIGIDEGVTRQDVVWMMWKLQAFATKEEAVSKDV